MSYVILSIQYKRNIIEKIQDFLLSNHNQESIEFNTKSSCYIEEGYDDSTQKVLTGINKDLKCMGYDYHNEDKSDFELTDLNISELLLIMDNLLEGKFNVLQPV